ncbi:unnamed protein product [Sphagnum tenellum]
MLQELLGGRDNSINFTSCAKGQWGTQVKIYKRLLESSFRTFEKEKANFFFVPAYVKCVHMMGGLTDTETSDIYSKTSCFLFSWPPFQDGRSILGITGDRIDKQSTSSFNTLKDVIIPGKLIASYPLQTSKAGCNSSNLESSSLKSWMHQCWGFKGLQNLIIQRVCVPVILSDEINLPFQKCS